MSKFKAFLVDTFYQVILELNASHFSRFLHSFHADAEGILHLNSSEHEDNTAQKHLVSVQRLLIS